MPTHRVEPGDCISSIAARHGLSWQALWELPANEDLRAQRLHPNLLVPGDEVVLPAVAQGRETVTTNRRHTFVVDTGAVRLRLRLVRNGEPLVGEPYRVEVEGRTLRGETDADGLLDQEVPATAREAALVLEGRDERFTLALGELQPPETPAGFTARLRNLGLFAGEPVDELGPKARHAVAVFQHAQDLRPTGELDDATVDRLVELHGC